MTFTIDQIRLLDKKVIIVLIGLTLVVISNLIGHFAPSFSLFITPILLPILIAGLNSILYRANYYLTVLYGFGLLLLNDVLIRLYGGGIHDDAGRGWIMLIFVIAFSICFLAMIPFAFTGKLKTKNNKVVALTRLSYFIIIATLVGLFYYMYVGTL